MNDPIPCMHIYTNTFNVLVAQTLHLHFKKVFSQLLVQLRLERYIFSKYIGIRSKSTLVAPNTYTI